MNIPQTSRRTLAACAAVISIASLASIAHAGPMFVYLVVDPTTTAGAGVPKVNGLGVTSSRSGPGTWHLYALDDSTADFGIRNYNISLTGTIPAINHRSPNDAAWDTATSDGPFAAGFNDLRSGSNVNAIVAGQGLANVPNIGGFGQTAGDFQTREALSGNVPATHPGAISGAWGLYADPGTSGVTSPAVGGSGLPRNALFIAEGTYTGAAPTVGSASIAVWTNAALTTSGFAPTPVLNSSPLLCLECSPPAVHSLIIDNVDANNPGLIDRMPLVRDFSGTTSSVFTFDSYIPAPGASGTGPAIAATYDPAAGQWPDHGEFKWQTVGSPLGTYKWNLSATNFYGTGQGTITVHITVPEPATFALAAIACTVISRVRRHQPA